jgi:hypothetical protein
MKRFLTLVLLLLACAPDTVPPVLVSSNPSDGAGNVFFGEELRLQFSENILPSSVNAGTLTLTATIGAISQPVPHSVNVEGSVVQIRVAAIPEFPANYALVADGVTDPSGNRAPLATMSFSSQPWLPVGGKLNTSPKPPKSWLLEQCPCCGVARVQQSACQKCLCQTLEWYSVASLRQ